MRAPTLTRTGRAGLAALVALAALVGQSAPAFGDPAEPTDYESNVAGVVPDVVGVVVEVAGGDAFLVITVSPGHEVMVPGYFGEPYLSIDNTGTVSVNGKSPSKYVNEDRLGQSPVPESADAEAAPEWEVVGSNGTYAWHDHRTHWMNTDRPPGVIGGSTQEVFEWEIPIVVDGTPVLVSGSLDWHPSVTALPYLLAGMAALIPLVWWRRLRVKLLGWLVVAGALAATVLSTFDWLATPAPVRSFPTMSLAPLLALILGAAAWRIARRRPVGAAMAAVAACVALVVFVLGSIAVFSSPVLPSAVPDSVERLLTAAVGWLALGCAALAISRLVALAGPLPSAEG
ncbi:MAG: hypothetical protein ACR2OI_00970 [Acidimicrobiia bacterium]